MIPEVVKMKELIVSHQRCHPDIKLKNFSLQEIGIEGSQNYEKDMALQI